MERFGWFLVVFGTIATVAGALLYANNSSADSEAASLGIETSSTGQWVAFGVVGAVILAVGALIVLTQRSKS